MRDNMDPETRAMVQAAVTIAAVTVVLILTAAVAFRIVGG